MAAPNPYANTPEDFTDADWKEFVRAWSPASGTFTNTSAQYTQVGFIPEAKELAAIRYFLGYHAVSEDGTRRLLRTPPVAHPKYRNLYCTGVSPQCFQPDPRAPNTLLNRGLKRPAKVTDPEGGRKINNFAGYQKTQLTLHFEPLAFPLEPDSDQLANNGANSPTNGNYEWRRWCTWDAEPRVEVISLDGQSLYFAEGTANTGVTSNPKGQPFPADNGKLIVKCDLAVKWFDVPSDWVETPNFIPHKILKGLGKVNRFSFGDMGGVSGPAGTLLFYPPGTLLLSAVKIQRYPNALYHPGTTASRAIGRESRYYFAVEFFFTFFDPPKGLHNNAPITTDRGHNCCFWRGKEGQGKAVTGDLNAGKWFLATFTGEKGTTENPDPRLFDPFNFAMLFDCWRNDMRPGVEG